MRNKTLTLIGGLVLCIGAANLAVACDQCGCPPGASHEKTTLKQRVSAHLKGASHKIQQVSARQKGTAHQKGVVIQKGACQKGACQKGPGCQECQGDAWNGYCAKGCRQGSCLTRHKTSSCGCETGACQKGACQKGACQQGCSKGGKCSSDCGDGCGCGASKKGSGGRFGGLFGGKFGGKGGGKNGGQNVGPHWGPMPQTCYQPRYGCYAGNNRHMHRYPAFHGYYYRRPYNYRNLFDYPWHADLHEPTSLFSYNVPPEENLTDEGPGFDNDNVSSPNEPETLENPSDLENIVPPLPEEEARRPVRTDRRQASTRPNNIHTTIYRR
jgi:hypothetical protein